ncbi:hypothetical protein [Pseudomonas aeruginosa]|uniref:hypothetical protein n=1 Tax=Pseudomonas aeruginosa TaxID=287 RepID=UPI000F834970|nr:hypothetical protein [Pseudomonas aeruginosa]MBW8455509.1 hypothetical protein [Pseudomonas sp.]MBH4102396.1 hypothetical protein [Pseudomonas aeruginosa]RTV59317.1 hypothetical protein DY992_03540 [Pseudomonas aeruginosa]HCF3907968.1 hypothetical protein [Pseudomonas aeruginosa]HEJ2731284.1 hypothetical protein [Pseudomonas aeruginosa]
MISAKYLCIDDQTAETIDPVLYALEGPDKSIEFSKMHPKELAEQFERIKQESSRGVPFGVLVDLRLDELPDDDGNKVFYRGSTLAQDLRTRMALGEIDNFPIVLWSVNDKLARSYEPDSASHDLFDAVYLKDGPDVSSAEGIAKRTLQLQAFAVGYCSLKECLNPKGEGESWDLPRALGVSGADLDILDPRLVQYLLSSEVVYVFARKVLNSLIREEGILVGERMLAAKLGIDIEASGDSWEGLLSALVECRYSGIFSEAYTRWWLHRISSYWDKLNSGKGTLRRFGASGRVKVLNDALGLSLVAATPLVEGYSDRFSTLCVATSAALDTVDAFKVLRVDSFPWQESRYVSAYAAGNRINRTLWKIDPLEMERYLEFKEGLKNG